MAADTSRVRTLENAAGMAAVAADVLVRAVKLKTGGVMVERFLCAGSSAQQQSA